MSFHIGPMSEEASSQQITRRRTPIPIDETFLELIASLERLVLKAAESIDKAELEYFIPFHYNTVEVIVPSYHIQKYVPGLDADITVTFMRTKFTEEHNLKYTLENIVEYYKTASVTIGKHGSNRVYHINMKGSWLNGDFPYRTIADNIKRLYAIHEKHQTFDITSSNIDDITRNLVTIVNPTSSHFPRSFTL